MPDPLLCPRCGGDEVIPRVRVAERGESNARYDLQVEVQRRPNAVLFKRPERADLTARVCGAREALAESQIRLGELEEKLAFVEQLLQRDRPLTALPKAPD